ncbi:hypothetical protein KUTeg_009899 [Tegillarca granosa]|uniref:FMP27/BLTP2/Hobbit GFWDK motif-containing RBG unit domain-containing protein n=1 Tax=Tegillarca granosa TaxID=220873 RepID=A0ABQ9F7I5_TEGGR|nr:hypothetical protein KUTeg_009899 [Tegillarca granosa]
MLEVKDMHLWGRLIGAEQNGTKRDVKSWIMAYGACWEPAIAQYNISLDLINKPSIDPSRPLPIWDKIRLLLHGRLTMSVEQMSWLYLASFDPYNTTEMMDWFWSNVILDWTNGKCMIVQHRRND